MGEKIMEDLPSEKSFGITFIVVLFVVICIKILHDYSPGFIIPLFILILSAITFFKPSLLRWPNILWFRFGLLLHIFFSPLILGLIYFTIFPIMRVVAYMLKKDLLKLNKSHDRSY